MCALSPPAAEAAAVAARGGRWRFPGPFLRRLLYSNLSRGPLNQQQCIDVIASCHMLYTPSPCGLTRVLVGLHGSKEAAAPLGMPSYADKQQQRLHSVDGHPKDSVLFSDV
uniref:Uncharacterized protein n=1 Tax=Leersia perrieri TaxID=77586 RepID=A0A0D9XZA4_9ORYZ